MQRFDVRTGFGCLPSFSEYIGGVRQQLILPLHDLIRVNIESCGQLRQGLFPFKRCQCYFSFEGRSVVAS